MTFLLVALAIVGVIAIVLAIAFGVWLLVSLGRGWDTEPEPFDVFED